MMGLYSALVKRYGWSLRDIDNTNLDTLIEFIYYQDTDPNIKVINGKTYHRAEGIPQWL